jgi:hypothetical protein
LIKHPAQFAFRRKSRVTAAMVLFLRHFHGLLWPFMAGTPRIYWRPHGDSNPSYRRERAETPPCDQSGSDGCNKNAHWLYRSAVILAAVFAPQLALADDLWLNVNLASYHFDRTKGYNEQNLGIGAEYRRGDHLRFIGGEYDNSFNRTSWYAGAAYFTKPLIAVFGVDARAGLAGGAVTGYDHTRPLLLPAISFERGRWEANIAFAPKASPKASALLALQLGGKF